MAAREIFLESLEQLARPLVRYCLRHSIKFRELSDLLKRSFLRIAQEEIAQKKLAASASKLSVMTGLQRREVLRLLLAPESGENAANLITRIVGQWASDRRFCDKRGRPKALTFEGLQSDFARLVRVVSKDLSHHTVLFELERLGTVKRRQGKAVLVFPAHIPRGNIRAGLMMLAEDAHDLMCAVEENLSEKLSIPNLHARTQYDAVPREHLPEIRRWLIKFGQQIHDRARKYLSRFDTDINPKLRGRSASQRTRVVLGTFSRIEVPAQAIEEKEGLHATKNEDEDGL